MDYVATLYSDSCIFSMLHYKGGFVPSLAQRMKTREWWRLERHNYRMLSSLNTESELSRGEFAEQRLALAEARRLPYLPATRAVQNCTQILLECRMFPIKSRADAVQLATATIHTVDYLLTWDYTHLANKFVVDRIAALCKKYNWRAPQIVSPETILWTSMGQTIRRRE